MAKGDTISMSVIRRLPRYYRFLYDLKENGVTRISSRELSQRMGLTASQIRQDLNCFGGFGQQGYGYMVEQLYTEIGHILGMDRLSDTVLLGAGNMGRAIANHMDFENRGIRLVGIFDDSPELIGKTVRGMEVQPPRGGGTGILELQPLRHQLLSPRGRGGECPFGGQPDDPLLSAQKNRLLTHQNARDIRRDVPGVLGWLADFDLAGGRKRSRLVCRQLQFQYAVLIGRTDLVRFDAGDIKAA